MIERRGPETEARRDLSPRDIAGQAVAPIEVPMSWLAPDGATAVHGAAGFHASLPPSMVLSLQRAAGNAAVNRYLQRRSRGLSSNAAANPSPMTDDSPTAEAASGAEPVAEAVGGAAPGVAAEASIAAAGGDDAGGGGSGGPRAGAGGGRGSPRPERSWLARTEALALDEDDLAYIQQVLEDETEGDQPEAPESGPPDASASPPAPPAGSPPPGEEAATTAIIQDKGVAYTGILADGTGPAGTPRSLDDLDPGSVEGIAKAGVVTEEFSESAFKSLKALGFINIGAGAVFPPQATLEIEGIPPKGTGFKKQWKLLPTTTKDFSFKATAAPAGVYDTGMTVTVTVGGTAVELKKLVEVTDGVAAKCKAFEQEHVDDTVAAFQLSFQEAADAVNHFADAPGGKSPIYFRGEDEATVTGYVEGRLTDYHGKPKLGGKTSDWVSAYKKLLGLTISERDAKGTHSWGLAPQPKVDRAAGTVTYQLTPPGVNAGPPWEVVSWDKV
jgi:hypothetical protein